eukprot:gb/GEZN01023339.1/.p1 GENE.gb/GEZN01023339.1/~~gb/GEZN01023339.1/.p1  ORF type:complete len:136 (+),score=7.87 gb/GEZN01023339.1/:115-522(+)
MVLILSSVPGAAGRTTPQVTRGSVFPIICDLLFMQISIHEGSAQPHSSVGLGGVEEALCCVLTGKRRDFGRVSIHHKMCIWNNLEKVFHLFEPFTSFPSMCLGHRKFIHPLSKCKKFSPQVLLKVSVLMLVGSHL